MYGSQTGYWFVSQEAVYEFFTIKYDIIVYTNVQYFNVMCVAAECT